MAGLDFAGVHRQRGQAAGEAAADVRAAAAGAQPQLALDVPVEPGPALRRHRGTGQHDGGQRGQVVAVPGHQARLVHQVGIRRARAKERHARVLRQLPQHVRPRVPGMPVVQQRAHAQQQRADQEVPHHPAAGGVEEHPHPRAQVHVEGLQLQLFDEDAAVTVRERLGQPGGAGGKQDPQRMTKRHLLEPEPGGRHRRVCHDLRPGDRLRAAGNRTGRPAGPAPGSRAPGWAGSR